MRTQVFKDAFPDSFIYLFPREGQKRPYSSIGAQDSMIEPKGEDRHRFYPGVIKLQVASWQTSGGKETKSWRDGSRSNRRLL